MNKILLSFLIAVLFIGAFSAMAQNNSLPSPGITPDSPFYFLKAWKETIQTFLTFGAENKARQFLHLADVRLAEYQKMIEKGKNEIAQKTLQKYEKQLDHALQKVEELKTKGIDVQGAAQQIENTLNKHVEILKINLQNVPEAAKTGIQKALESSSKAIEKAKVRTGKEKTCVDSGGTVSTSPCCQLTGDFPSNCLIGACGCSPDNSHQIKVCDCGPDKCFDGNQCVPLSKANEDAACVSRTGKSMLLSEAKQIARDSECDEEGNLEDNAICNADTATWWIDLNIVKENCSPACVVNIETKQAEINWRCTGLLPEF